MYIITNDYILRVIVTSQSLHDPFGTYLRNTINNSELPKQKIAFQKLFLLCGL